MLSSEQCTPGNPFALFAKIPPKRLAVFAWLMWLTVRRGARDPVCGMTVDRGAPAARRGGRFLLLELPRRRGLSRQGRAGAPRSRLACWDVP